MEIMFLGNWAAKPEAGKETTSFMLDRKIVCELGPGTVKSMVGNGADPDEIEHVLISHMHYDHFAGLVGLLWYRAMTGNEEELLITGPKGIEAHSRKLLECYDTPGGFHIYASFNEEGASDGVEVVHGSHTVADNAYRISSGGKTIFYSGDTSYSEEIVNGASNADLLIHEMTYPDQLRIEADLWKHSTVSDVISVFERSQSKRLIPVHLTAETYRVMPVLQGEFPEVYMPEEKFIL